MQYKPQGRKYDRSLKARGEAVNCERGLTDPSLTLQNQNLFSQINLVKTCQVVRVQPFYPENETKFKVSSSIDMTENSKLHRETVYIDAVAMPSITVHAVQSHEAEPQPRQIHNQYRNTVFEYLLGEISAELWSKATRKAVPATRSLTT